MTNGDMMIAIYGIADVEVNERSVRLFPKDGGQLWMTRDWWNAEFKEPTDKIDCKHTECNNCINHKYCDYEPTTKNDLEVDCVARQDVERFIEGFINEYTPEEELEFINLELDGLKHLPPATPQELKPMVEIDLYSVIKQKYIEREVLDKIRAEIEKARNTEIKEFNEETDIVEPTSYQRGSHEGYDEAITDVLQIIDKYKAEGSKEA